MYVLSLCGRFGLSTQKGSCWPPSQAFPVSDFPFLHTKINKRQRRLRNKDFLAPSDTLLSHNYMTQIDHYVSILQGQHHYVVPRPSSAPGKYEQGGLMAAHSVLPCWIDRQDSLAT